MDLSGTIQDLADLTVDLALTRLDGQVRARPVALAQPSRARLDAGVVDIIEPTRLTVGESTLDVGRSPAAVPGAELVVAVNGPVADIVTLAPGLVPEGVTADGTVKAEVFLGARLDTFQPTGQATLEVATLRRGDQELASGVKVVADADRGTIHVSDAAGTVLGSAVSGQATIPMSWLRQGTASPGNGSAEPASFSLRSTVAVAPILAELMDEPPSDLTGTLNLTVDGTASAPRLDAVRARVQEQGGDVTVGNIKLSTQRTTALRFEDGLLHVDAFEWSGPEFHDRGFGQRRRARGRGGTTAAGRQDVDGAAQPRGAGQGERTIDLRRGSDRPARRPRSAREDRDRRRHHDRSAMAPGHGRLVGIGRDSTKPASLSKACMDNSTAARPPSTAACRLAAVPPVAMRSGSRCAAHSSSCREVFAASSTPTCRGAGPQAAPACPAAPPLPRARIASR